MNTSMYKFTYFYFIEFIIVLLVKRLFYLFGIVNRIISSQVSTYSNPPLSISWNQQLVLELRPYQHMPNILRENWVVTMRYKKKGEETLNTIEDLKENLR